MDRISFIWLGHLLQGRLRRISTMIMPMNSRPVSNVITDTIRSAVPGSVRYASAADTNVIIMAIRNQACPASGFIGLYQMTSCLTTPVGFLEWRYDLFAHLACKDWTAGMERAARRKSQQAGHICTA